MLKPIQRNGTHTHTRTTQIALLDHFSVSIYVLFVDMVCAAEHQFRNNEDEEI